jgi:hypothetical protein
VYPGGATLIRQSLRLTQGWAPPISLTALTV